MTAPTLPGTPPMASVKRAGVTPGDVASPARCLAPPSGADASPARLAAAAEGATVPAPSVARRDGTPIERLLQRIEVTAGPLTSPCWLCTFTRDRHGYAVLSYKHKKYRCHRVAYLNLVGPIPEGLVLDHLCRVRHCVNPSHLEPVTLSENMLRGESPIAVATRLGRCLNGHDLSRGRSGSRHLCLVCIELRNLRRRQQPSRGSAVAPQFAPVP